VEVAHTFPTTVPYRFERIYEQPTLTAVHHTDLLATDPDLHLALAPHLANTTHEDEATTDVLWEPLPAHRQKVRPGVKSLPGTAMLQDLVERIGCRKPRLLGS